MAGDQVSGFSDVDSAAEPVGFVDYLDRAAEMLAERRHARYPLLALGPGAAVLDAGCGAGEVCRDLRRIVGPTGRVVGVDASSTMIDTARSRVSDAEFDVADITALPFEDETFDAARAERVLQHVAEPQEAVTELARVVRAGGRVVLIDPDHLQADVATDHREVWAAIRFHGPGAVRNPQAGLRLREWVIGAGLVEVQLIAATFEPTWEQLQTTARLKTSIAGAVADGTLDAPDGERFMAEQNARAAAGTFHTSLVGYTIAATKP